MPVHHDLRGARGQAGGVTVRIDSIEAIHVYMKGDVSQEGAEAHTLTMDCWCEPTTKIFVEQNPRASRCLPIVVHGPFIDVEAVEVKSQEGGGSE